MKRLYILLCSSLAFNCNATVEKSNLIRSIMVHNNIKPEMLEYSLLKMKYTPDSFSLKANGTLIKPGTSLPIPTEGNTLIIRYDYSFAKGWRTGAKEIVFELEKDTSECDVQFSWNNQWRIIAGGAQPQKVKRMKFNT